jgi:hypothetical protein
MVGPLLEKWLANPRSRKKIRKSSGKCQVSLHNEVEASKQKPMKINPMECPKSCFAKKKGVTRGTRLLVGALCISSGLLWGGCKTDSETLPAKPASVAAMASRKVIHQRMMRIYEAIQAYRTDHKELPAYLSDLYPQYIGDTNVFLCPEPHSSDIIPFPSLKDPKMQVDYAYEFNANPLQGLFGYQGPMTMADFKRLQMAAVGGNVPILRCFLNGLGQRVLNVSFDGKYYESGQYWEYGFTNRVDFERLVPGQLQRDWARKLGPS